VIDAVITVLALALLAIPSVLAPALLGIRGRAPYAVAVLLTAAADVVVCTIVLSLPRWVTRPGMLVAMALVAAGTAVLWQLRGRPRPPRLRDPGAPWPRLGAVWIIVAIAGVALLVQLYANARLAPSNWDSMTYHLSRAAYWLQQDAALHYPGGSVRQLGSAPNAEILLAWTMLITGTDRWVELVQWTSLIGLALTIFSGARLLRFSAPASAFAAALFVILPEAIMQAASTQNDIVVSFFVAATAFFAARGIRDRTVGDLAVAGAALGLALGTKGTAFMALPALGVVAVAAWVAWRPPIRLVAIGAGLAVAGVIVLGSFNYVLNYKNSHNVLGNVDEMTALHGGSHRSNAAHDLWTFADAPGTNITWLQPLVERPVKAVFGGTFGAGFPYTIDTSVQEDTSAYGLVGFLLLFPLLLWVLVAPRSLWARRVLALGALLYFAVFSLRVADNAWLGRIYMPGVALAAPLFAVFARRAWAAGAVGALAVLTLVPSLLQNSQKPILLPEGQKNIFALDRVHQMTVLRPEMWSITEQATWRSGGSHTRIGYAGGEDSWDYPLFGAHRTHYIKRFGSANDVSYAEMARDHLRGTVFANVGPPPAPLRAVPMGDDYYWVAARGAP
jgi:hypothetical protein